MLCLIRFPTKSCRRSCEDLSRSQWNLDVNSLWQADNRQCLSFVPASDTDLSNSVFGNGVDLVNLSSQYAAYSHNKLDFIKAADRVGTAYTITNGVVTVAVTTKLADGVSTMRNAITAQLNSDFSVSNPDELANHIMCCSPPGMMSYIAYAWVNSWMSVYSDKWWVKFLHLCHTCLNFYTATLAWISNTVRCKGCEYLWYHYYLYIYWNHPSNNTTTIQLVKSGRLDSACPCWLDRNVLIREQVLGIGDFSWRCHTWTRTTHVLRCRLLRLLLTFHVMIVPPSLSSCTKMK